MRYILTYGGLAGAITIIVLCLTFVVDLPSHSHSEWFGYLVMLIALSMIFIGIKRYRDVEKGGVIRFLPAFGLGLGMAVLAGVIYVAGWEAFLASSERDFIAEYSAATMAQLHASGASTTEIAAEQAELDWAAEIYRSPIKRMGFTFFFEIFPVGLLVALVSAAVLRNPRILPARAAT